ncbi:HEAT repeat-containing [Heracleum sosnowskyi]|uniref:HEAT repeat-containing n=1 Tax=Heracleum sosnowskyi TaxID=360622 RepID=A0AAD8IUR4_9APIA|nr:HEAT repeat-containing [Heracleum sosnowskyi]
MGGGAAMRAAAKVAGMNMGLRGVPGAEHPFAAAARKAVSPVKAFFNTNQTRAYWDDSNIEEWELAGGEEELMTEEARLVFGGAPTLKEAQDATFQLKEAVNKAYDLSTDEVFSNDESKFKALLNSEDLESIACVVKDTTSPTLPTQAMQAFRLLNENTVAQQVVASIACDPNVWNAVLQNEALVGFLRSQKSSSEMDASSEKSAEDMSELEYCNSEDMNVIENIVLNMKETVVEMMNSLSDYFQNLFGGTVAPDGSVVTNTIDKDKAMSASFMGLAVMVLMVVVLDRP